MFDDSSTIIVVHPTDLSGTNYYFIRKAAANGDPDIDPFKLHALQDVGRVITDHTDEVFIRVEIHLEKNGIWNGTCYDVIELMFSGINRACNVNHVKHIHCSLDELFTKEGYRPLSATV